MMRHLTIVLAACMTCIAGCGQNDASNREPMSTGTVDSSIATAQDWQRVSTLKVAYGHQSVGAQVISSIEAQARENHVTLQIDESRTTFSGPGLHHFRIGVNGDPSGKLVDFKTAVSEQLAGSADIALMELCYVDFDADTNAQRLAKQYIAQLDQLTARFPHTTFVPVTALLTTVQTGPKAIVKRLLGKEPAGYAENARRKVFNDALRARYAPTKLLFDVAAVESRSGTVAINRNGERIEMLDPSLSSDGGHLNERGQRLISSALVHHLAAITPHDLTAN